MSNILPRFMETEELENMVEIFFDRSSKDYIQKFPDPDESGCQYVMDSNELYQSHPELNFECDVDELIEQSELDRENEYQHY